MFVLMVMGLEMRPAIWVENTGRVRFLLMAWVRMRITVRMMWNGEGAVEWTMRIRICGELAVVDGGVCFEGKTLDVHRRWWWNSLIVGGGRHGLEIVVF